MSSPLLVSGFHLHSGENYKLLYPLCSIFLFASAVLLHLAVVYPIPLQIKQVIAFIHSSTTTIPGGCVQVNALKHELRMVRVVNNINGVITSSTLARIPSGALESCRISDQPPSLPPPCFSRTTMFTPFSHTSSPLNPLLFLFLHIFLPFLPKPVLACYCIDACNGITLFVMQMF